MFRYIFIKLYLVINYRLSNKERNKYNAVVYPISEYPYFLIQVYFLCYFNMICTL